MKKGKKDEDYPHFPTFFTFYPFYLLLFSTIIIFTLLPFPYLVSKSYIQIKVERFFFVDGVERRVVVEEIAQARLCIDANVVGNQIGRAHV